MATATEIRKYTNEQVQRGCELVDQARTSQLELGDLLLEIAPWKDDDGEPTGKVVAAFADEIGLSHETARQYRKVSARYGVPLREKIAGTGVKANYSAIRRAVLGHGYHNLRVGDGSVLLVEACQRAAANGRGHVTEADVEAIRDEHLEAQDAARRSEIARQNAKRAAVTRQFKALQLLDTAEHRAALTAYVDQQRAAGSDIVEVVLELHDEIGGSLDELAGLAPLTETEAARLVKRSMMLGRVTSDLRCIVRDAQRVAESLCELSTVAASTRQELREQHDAAMAALIEVGELLRDADA